MKWGVGSILFFLTPYLVKWSTRKPVVSFEVGSGSEKNRSLCILCHKNASDGKRLTRPMSKMPDRDDESAPRIAGFQTSGPRLRWRILGPTGSGPFLPLQSKSFCRCIFSDRVCPPKAQWFIQPPDHLRKMKTAGRDAMGPRRRRPGTLWGIRHVWGSPPPEKWLDKTLSEAYTGHILQ